MLLSRDLRLRWQDSRGSLFKRRNSSLLHPKLIMIFTETPLAGAFVIQLRALQDDRGFFVRTFDAEAMRERGLVDVFPQANHSMCTIAGTVRGLHYQNAPSSETKLLRCVSGRIFDVMVDVRRGSPTFLQWFGIELAEGDFTAVYVPSGFAHGYQALTCGAEVSYQSSAKYAPHLEGRVRFDEPRVGIAWPVAKAILSPKDYSTPFLDACFVGVD